MGINLKNSLFNGGKKMEIFVDIY